MPPPLRPCLIMPILLACGTPQDTGTPGADYLLYEPADWDGSSPLAIMMLIHGYSGSPESTATEETIAQVSDQGMLLVVPRGQEGSWSSTHSPSDGMRDDVAFLSGVLDRVAQDFPVDGVFAVGFSQGASMVEDFAWKAPERVTGAAPISGGFWLPVPKTPGECPSGPIPPISHTHGTNDATWPMEGRSLDADGTFTQAPLDENLAFWRACGGCEDASETFENGVLNCERWNDCANGGPVQVCLHDGGHGKRSGWVERQTEWFRTISGQGR